MPRSAWRARPVTTTRARSSFWWTLIRDWRFIEVNPRIQVEHTVTEMVTGVDIVRPQIQIAQGLTCTARRSICRGKRRSCFTVAAMPHHHGKTQRQSLCPRLRQVSTTARRFRIRLDGGSAYSGAVITLYYDSLLVKTTAWGRELCLPAHGPEPARVSRARREDKIFRFSKTS